MASFNVHAEFIPSSGPIPKNVTPSDTSAATAPRQGVPLPQSLSARGGPVLRDPKYSLPFSDIAHYDEASYYANNQYESYDNMDMDGGGQYHHQSRNTGRGPRRERGPRVVNIGDNGVMLADCKDPCEYCVERRRLAWSHAKDKRTWKHLPVLHQLRKCHQLYEKILSKDCRDPCPLCTGRRQYAIKCGDLHLIDPVTHIAAFCPTAVREIGPNNKSHVRERMHRDEVSAGSMLMSGISDTHHSDSRSGPPKVRHGDIDDIRDKDPDSVRDAFYAQYTSPPVAPDFLHDNHRTNSSSSNSDTISIRSGPPALPGASTSSLTLGQSSFEQCCANKVIEDRVLRIPEIRKCANLMDKYQIDIDTFVGHLCEFLVTSVPSTGLLSLSVLTPEDMPKFEEFVDQKYMNRPNGERSSPVSLSQTNSTSTNGADDSEASSIFNGLGFNSNDFFSSPQLLANNSRTGSSEAPLSDLQSAQEEERHIEFMKQFKIEKCLDSSQHNYSSCMYYHNGVRPDRRRDPFGAVNYCAQECPNMPFSGSGTCPDGNLCLYCHSRAEYMYHPSVYKTDMCSSPECCEYDPFCPKAHLSSDLRYVTDVVKSSDFPRFSTDNASSGGFDYTSDGANSSPIVISSTTDVSAQPSNISATLLEQLDENPITSQMLHSSVVLNCVALVKRYDVTVDIFANIVKSFVLDELRPADANANKIMPFHMILFQNYIERTLSKTNQKKVKPWLELKKLEREANAAAKAHASFTYQPNSHGYNMKQPRGGESNQHSYIDITNPSQYQQQLNANQLSGQARKVKSIEEFLNDERGNNIPGSASYNGLSQPLVNNKYAQQDPLEVEEKKCPCDEKNCQHAVPGKRTKGNNPKQGITADVPDRCQFCLALRRENPHCVFFFIAHVTSECKQLAKLQESNRGKALAKAISDNQQYEARQEKEKEAELAHTDTSTMSNASQTASFASIVGGAAATSGKIAPINADIMQPNGNKNTMSSSGTTSTGTNNVSKKDRLKDFDDPCIYCVRRRKEFPYLAEPKQSLEFIRHNSNDCKWIKRQMAEAAATGDRTALSFIATAKESAAGKTIATGTSFTKAFISGSSLSESPSDLESSISLSSTSPPHNAYSSGASDNDNISSRINNNNKKTTDKRFYY
jgi:hypothetical protein